MIASLGLVTSFIPPIYPSRYGDSQPGRHFSMAPRILRLSGLRRLIVVSGVLVNTTSQDVRGFLGELKESFGRQSLVSVGILIRFRKHKPGSASRPDLTAGQYAGWARDTELALLKPSETQR